MKPNIPLFFEEILKKEYNEKNVKNILNGLCAKRKTTLRVNTLKTNINKIKEKLEQEKIKFSEVEWNKDAIVIEDVDETTIRSMEEYKNGELYMQSLSSMIPPIIVDPKEKESILDMAAAPGGKTTQMACLSQNLAMITACEKNKIRCEKLKYNLEKQGATRVSVLNADARKLDDYLKFDKILLDSPCSGSGTINLLDENLNKYFSEELIKRSSEIQKELLRKASKLIKIGGEIIYSTCSVLKEENEKVVESLIKNGNFEVVPVENIKGIPTLPTYINGTICVEPNGLYEGFFVAKIKRIK